MLHNKWDTMYITEDDVATPVMIPFEWSLSVTMTRNITIFRLIVVVFENKVYLLKSDSVFLFYRSLVKYISCTLSHGQIKEAFH